MKMSNPLWLIFLASTFTGNFELCLAKPVLKKLENCHSTVDHALKFSNVTIKTVGDKQYVDSALTLTALFDNNLRVNATVEVLIGNNYEYMFSINERKGCDALNKYYGEFIYELERYAQIIPGICPIPAGKYHVHNAPLNFDKLVTLRVFPIGSLRIFQNFYTKDNGVYSCVLVEFENYL